MAVTPNHLEKVLKEKLGAAAVEVNDTSGGCGQAFEVTVVSEQFQGKNKLARARMVNSALKDEIAAIHAFTQKTFSVQEWESR